LRVTMFEFVAKIEEALTVARLAKTPTRRLAMFAVLDVLSVTMAAVTTLAVATFAVVTFADTRLAKVFTRRVAMFAVLRTFRKVPTVSEPTFAVTIFEVVTLSVRTFADAAKRLLMFAETKFKVEIERNDVLMTSMLAVPRTNRLEPTGGFVRVPMLTPFPKATFEFTDVH
jgi:hypothetical protein